MGRRPPLRDVDSKLNRARADHGAGQLARATRAYDRILQDSPDRVDVLRLRAIAARQTGDLGLARDLLQRAAHLRPDDGPTLNSLGLCLMAENAFSEAGVAFRRVLKIDGRFPGALTSLALARYGDGEVDEAGERLRRAVELDPDDARAHAALGCLEFEAGADGEASAHLKKAAKLDGAYGFGAHCHLGDSFFALSDPAGLPELGRALPEPRGVGPLCTGDHPVVVTCCDDAEYVRFGRRLAESLDRNSPGGALHLHIVNPEPETVEDYERLSRGLSSTRFTVTVERTLDRDPLYLDRIRYLRFSQFLSECGGNLFCLDPDSLVLAGLDTLMGTAGGGDIAVPLRPVTLDINQKAFCAAMLLRPTDATRKFIGRLAAYMLSVSRDGVPAHHLDQCAFFIASRMLGRSGDTPLLQPLPARFADNRFDDASSVWTAGAGRAFTHTLDDAPPR